MRRWLVAAVLLPLALPLAYVSAALLLGLVPINRDFRPAPEDGAVPIYLRTNGVHAEFVLPAHGAHDWTREFPLPAVVGDAKQRSLPGLNWIAFGWGDRAFYLQTPRWRDLRWHTVLGALGGRGPAAMHVEYLARPEDYRAVRIAIDEGRYAMLVAYVRAGFARDAQGRPIRIDHPGYFATDAFFEGTGHYSPWLTSNEWVRRGLAEAGVRSAVWSPFDRPLFWQLVRRREATEELHPSFIRGTPGRLAAGGGATRACGAPPGSRATPAPASPAS